MVQHQQYLKKVFERFNIPKKTSFAFSAILNNETHRKLIDSFLDKSDRNIILIFENSDSLNILTEFPIQFKSKIICFVKRYETIIDKDIPLKKQLTIAEFTQSCITQLNIFVSEVKFFV
jgi:hypothetical protein